MSQRNFTIATTDIVRDVGLVRISGVGRFVVGDWDIEIHADDGNAGINSVIAAAEGIALSIEAEFDDDETQCYETSARVLADRILCTLPQVHSCQITVGNAGCYACR